MCGDSSWLLWNHKSRGKLSRAEKYFKAIGDLWDKKDVQSSYAGQAEWSERLMIARAAWFMKPDVLILRWAHCRVEYRVYAIYVGIYKNPKWTGKRPLLTTPLFGRADAICRISPLYNDGELFWKNTSVIKMRLIETLISVKHLFCASW